LRSPRDIRNVDELSNDGYFFICECENGLELVWWAMFFTEAEGNGQINLGLLQSCKYWQNLVLL
jgi:hypothetical protein